MDLFKRKDYAILQCIMCLRYLFLCTAKCYFSFSWWNVYRQLLIADWNSNAQGKSIEVANVKLKRFYILFILSGTIATIFVPCRRLFRWKSGDNFKNFIKFFQIWRNAKNTNFLDIEELLGLVENISAPCFSLSFRKGG